MWSEGKLILSRNTVKLDWFKLNVMCPVPILINIDTIRIFVAFCDCENKGRIGYIDVDASNPSNIKYISPKPVLDVGAAGMFDDSGVLPTSIFEEEGKLYMYYCGFQLHVNVPYTSLLGLAVSEDGGNHFIRAKTTPILERIEGELFIRTGSAAVKENGLYKLYYASGNEWFDLTQGKKEPIYNLREIQSKSKEIFAGNGKVILEVKNDEYGITMPQYLNYGGREILLFSVRSIRKGYRLEYAQKHIDKWVRKGEMGVKTSIFGWDSEMQCFGKILPYKDKVYLFYVGNHYGIGGLGWSVLMERKD